MNPSDNISAIEAVEKAMEGVTPGRWGQFHPNYAPEAEGTPFSTWDTSHDISAIKDGKKFGRIATFKHSSDAAYVDACSPDRMRLVLAEARKAEAMEREIAELRNVMRECHAALKMMIDPGDISGSTVSAAFAAATSAECRARTLLNGGSDAHD